MTDLERDPLIDAAMATLPEVHLPAELRRRVAQIPIVHGQGWMWPQLGSFKAAVTWALCGALGVVCGAYLDVGSLADPSALTALAGSDLDVSAQEEQKGDENLASIDQLVSQAWGNDWEAELTPTADSGPISDALKERAQ